MTMDVTKMQIFPKVRTSGDLEKDLKDACNELIEAIEEDLRRVFERARKVSEEHGAAAGKEIYRREIERLRDLASR